MSQLRSNLRLASLVLKGAYYSAYKLRDTQKMSPALTMENNARQTPDALALAFEDRRYSYAEFNAEANRVCHAFKQEGATKGDVVAVLMDNRPPYLFTMIGLNKRGVITSCINTNIRGDALRHALEICSPGWILVGEELLGALLEIKDSLPVPLERVLVWSQAGDAQVPQGMRAYDPLHAAAPDHDPGTAQDQGVKDAMLYIYTSGTTGLPKAAIMKNQRFMRAAFLFGKVVLKFQPSDVIYVALPLYHGTGTLLAWGSAMVNGASIVLRRKFSASHFWSDAVEYGVTAFPYIGEVCRYLMNAPKHPDERAHNVHTIVGAGMRPDIWERFQERFGIDRVVEFYGSTEGNVGIVNIEGRPGMLGRMMPGQVVVKVDPATEEVLRDAQGHCIQAGPGDQGVLAGLINRVNGFDGYLDRRKNNAKVLDDAFGDGKSYFNTGDLVNLHDHGWVSFADRLGDTFRWKGENVSTTQVAETLNGCDGVLESNVYGVEVPGTDGRAGMAAIVVEQNFKVDSLASHVKEALPGYSRPYFVRVQSQMVTTGSFKHVKTHLKKDGFDPEKVKDPIYFLNRSGDYEPVTPELFGKICEGELRVS